MTIQNKNSLACMSSAPPYCLIWGMVTRGGVEYKQFFLILRLIFIFPALLGVYIKLNHMHLLYVYQ